MGRRGSVLDPLFGFLERPLPRVVGDLWRGLRPTVWLATLVPFYLGHAAVTQTFAPSQKVWLDFWTLTLTSGANEALATSTFWNWWHDAFPFVFGLILLGPALWAGVRVLDKVAAKARARSSSLVAAARPRDGAALGLVVLVSVGLAWSARPALLLFLAAEVVVLVALFGPGLRLRERPAAAFVAGAFGLGSLSFAAGATVAGVPLADALPFAPAALLFVAALTAPAVVVDRRYLAQGRWGPSGPGARSARSARSSGSVRPGAGAGSKAGSGPGSGAGDGTGRAAPTVRTDRVLLAAGAVAALAATVALLHLGFRTDLVKWQFTLVTLPLALLAVGAYAAMMLRPGRTPGRLVAGLAVVAALWALLLFLYLAAQADLWHPGLHLMLGFGAAAAGR